MRKGETYTYAYPSGMQHENVLHSKIIIIYLLRNLAPPNVHRPLKMHFGARFKTSLVHFVTLLWNGTLCIYIVFVDFE